MSIRIQRHKQHNRKRNATTHLPEKTLRMARINNIRQIHPIIRGKERQGKENDGDTRENEDSFILAVRDDSKLVLLDGAELEEGVHGTFRVDQQPLEAVVLGFDHL